jgi:Protein of unknown function (DUF4236)/Bacterial SH3 domain
MPFYLRKTVRAGPFRFNLSKSGIGVSVGVKGLRIGTGPRGHYVHVGHGGLYYRASLGGTRHSPTSWQPIPASHPAAYTERSGVTMIEIQSGDVAAMYDSTVNDLIDDLNAKQAQVPIGVIAGVFFALIGVLALLQSSSDGQSTWPAIGIAALFAVLPAWFVGEWFDSFKRTSVVYYNLAGNAAAAYRKVTEAFDALTTCHGRWHIVSGGAVVDLTTWKRNAGAAHLVDRKAAYLTYSLPRVLRSNITPPSITLGSRTFFFLPEIMLVKHGRRFGAIRYNDLQIRSQTSRFIEDGTPPADAQIVDYTWKHPNKSGGPDRRFRDNRQLPVCLYDVMHLSSNSGVNELMEFSRTGFVQLLSASLRNLPHTQASESIGSIARLGTSATFEDTDGIVAPSKSSKWMALASIAALIVCGIAVVAAYAPRNTAHSATAGQVAITTLPSVPMTASVPPNPQTPTEMVTQKQTDASIQPTSQILPMVTVKTSANIRSKPSSTATVVRIASSGEKFGVFSRSNGWVQVGKDKPLGWIAASLLTD